MLRERLANMITKATDGVDPAALDSLDTLVARLHA